MRSPRPALRRRRRAEGSPALRRPEDVSASRRPVVAPSCGSDRPRARARSSNRSRPSHATTPAPATATRTALYGWSPKSGTTTSGQPAASALNVVPVPPCPTATDAMPEDVRLGDPLLDVDVRRHVAELDLVASSREKNSDGKVAYGVERARVDLRGRRKRRGDASEAHVHEWRTVFLPPVRQRLRSHLGSRVADTSHCEGGRIDRRREVRQVRRLGDAGRDPGLPLLERRRGNGQRALLDKRYACGHANVWNAVALCSDRGGELSGLAQHQVGTPVLDRLLERRKHRVDVQAGEDGRRRRPRLPALEAATASAPTTARGRRRAATRPRGTRSHAT